MLTNKKNLRKVLRINAGFSIISGLLLIFDKPLIDKMGIGNYQTPMIIGIALLIFAGSVFYTSRRLKPGMVKSIIIQDILWVLASIIVLVIQPWGLTALGYSLIAVVMIVIFMFAVFQFKYLKIIIEK